MLRRTIYLTLILALAAIQPLAADWSPGDGHKMHFPQLPDETGWDVNATQPLILADDWQCSESGWVKDVHFWGSWRNGIEGQVTAFVLSIHSDIPADQSPTGYSMPGPTLWEYWAENYVAVPIDPPSMQGWYDPQTGEVLPNDHSNYFQYNVFLPQEVWFWQEAGTIYWLNISAIIADTQNTQWGWKSTRDHWNDDAVWATWGNLNWVEMYEPSVPLFNDFQITILPGGIFGGGGGSGAYGDGWYFYPSEWWNIWFYDHPFREDRYKIMHLEFDLFKVDPGLPSMVTVALNWSTDLWSLEGNPEPDPRVPPLPGVDEARFIARQILISGPDLEGHFIFDYVVEEYNPEWVSVDVMGDNFVMEGVLMHHCVGQQSLDLSFVITGGADTCDYYKSSYLDYAPQGIPDFDQKQPGWTAPTGFWSHDGPAALANCLWWFDSKFEPNPVDPRPFGAVPPNDGYPLVTAYGQWDDHDSNNVHPFITDLADNYLNTNNPYWGTMPWDMQNGLRAYLASKGLQNNFTDTLVYWPSFDYLQGQVLESQNVILKLGFYEDVLTGAWSYIGSHYVTVAGVCTQAAKRQICISDPYLDMLEGEPPAGSAHGGTVHNDADNISGPHGQIQHDPYMCTVVMPPAWPVLVEEINYPASGAVGNFAGMNNPVDYMPWQGGPLHTIIEMALVICPAEPLDTCEYYKSQYPDYSPAGVPDFDQKQANWVGPPGIWTHCGPTALANCFWWFDSKFETNTIPPPAVIDNYPLVQSYTPTGLPPWDDHDPLNVVPFIDSLALYCQTNMMAPGTRLPGLAAGASAWLASRGLADDYTVRIVHEPPPELIREEVLRSQNVILLLGFWQPVAVDPTQCCRFGGHYVTVAGVCTTTSSICISDPWFDGNEGEPPAGSAHGSVVHNDAAFVSGPHGTIHHDKYTYGLTQIPCGTPFMYPTQVYDYPLSYPDIANFFDQNWSDPPVPNCPYQGGPLFALVEAALIICPTDECDCTPGDADGSGLVTISDAVYIINYIFGGGPAPTPYPICSGDADCSCLVTISDAVYLINYIFAGGPAPCDCNQWLSNCGPPLR